MSQLIEPTGQQDGEAARFLAELATAWHAFHGIETTAALAVLDFDDGRKGYLGDLPDTTEDLFACLSAYVEIPHPGTVHVVATVWQQQGLPFEFALSYEGIDGPLVLRFSDGSVLTGTVSPIRMPQDSWEAGVASGLVQQRLEEVASLARLAEIGASFSGKDQLIADAVIDLLSRLSTTERPPRTLTYEALRWLGRKVDLFVDEAAKTGGKLVGAVAAGAVGYVVTKHVPELRQAIHDAIELSR